METTGLVKLNAAHQALARAETVEGFKDIQEKAEVIRQYLKKSGASLKKQNKWAEVRLRVDRGGGRLRFF